MQIDAATYEGRVLKLQTDDRREAMRLVYGFNAGEYELKKATKRRSRDANAYAWKLCTEIAKAVGFGCEKEDVYRRAIKGVGKYIDIPIPAERVEEFSREWESRGIGSFVEVVGDDQIAGHKQVFAYIGSSNYDTKEMSVLIDYIIQDAKALDIETLPPDKLGALLEAWK